jgi:hypothetical protein
MNFLEWLGFKKVMEDTDPKNVVKFPEPKAIPKIPAVAPPKPKEHYRVGFDDQGMTTLTLMTDHGNSMTLSMNQDACEQLIRMLRATYKGNEK